MLVQINSSASVEDEKICKECGGNCCKSLPGLIHPRQVGAPNKIRMVHKLTKMFSSGNYAIDWWEGNDYLPKKQRKNYSHLGFFIRPARIYDPESPLSQPSGLRDPAWFGTCTFWNEESGCSIDLKHRPLGCQILVPDPSQYCSPKKGNFDKLEAARAWHPYHKIILEAEKLSGRD